MKDESIQVVTFYFEESISKRVIGIFEDNAGLDDDPDLWFLRVIDEKQDDVLLAIKDILNRDEFRLASTSEDLFEASDYINEIEELEGFGATKLEKNECIAEVLTFFLEQGWNIGAKWNEKTYTLACMSPHLPDKIIASEIIGDYFNPEAQFEPFV